MEDIKIINQRVKVAEEYLSYIDNALEEALLFSTKHSYLYDTTQSALQKVGLLKYHLSVMNRITESVEV
jgi:hypothetical protein